MCKRISALFLVLLLSCCTVSAQGSGLQISFCIHQGTSESPVSFNVSATENSIRFLSGLFPFYYISIPSVTGAKLLNLVSSATVFTGFSIPDTEKILMEWLSGMNCGDEATGIFAGDAFSEANTVQVF